MDFKNLRKLFESLFSWTPKVAKILPNYISYVIIISSKYAFPCKEQPNLESISCCPIQVFDKGAQKHT